MKERQDTFASEAGLADPEDYRGSCGVGVVFDLDGGAGHDVVADGLELLENLEHRGTTGAEENTGDGAGILLQIPHEFFQSELDTDLPPVREYAVGSIFLPTDEDQAAHLIDIFESELAERGLDVFEWRDVPTDAAAADLGETAAESEPRIVQAFVKPTDSMDDEAFDRALYVARRAVENRTERTKPSGSERFYVCSLARKTVVYKGAPEGRPDIGLLPGTRRRAVRLELRDGPRPVLHQHARRVASRSPLPPHHPQR